MDVLRYTYRLTWSAEDEQFVATCAEFPSLSWLASSQAEALTGLEDMLRSVVADMVQAGESVPEPFAERPFSGKFNVRVGPEVHRLLAVKAAEQGVSLNHLAVQKLSA